jgi:hypothetical protein
MKAYIVTAVSVSFDGGNDVIAIFADRAKARDFVDEATSRRNALTEAGAAWRSAGRRARHHRAEWLPEDEREPTFADQYSGCMDGVVSDMLATSRLYQEATMLWGGAHVADAAMPALVLPERKPWTPPPPPEPISRADYYAAQAADHLARERYREWVGDVSAYASFALDEHEVRE